MSRATVSRVERAHLGSLTLDRLRAIAGALDVRIDILPRWRGGELDRLVNARHSALHESLARCLGALPGWVFVPEVSFSIYGERGVVDILAWHAGRRAVLVIELKTDIVDVQELTGNLDRKRRLAARLARERGWDPASVSTWLVVLESKTNRRRVQAHAAMLRAAFPLDGRSVKSWLQDPVRPMAALGFWSDARGRNAKGDLPGTRRVRRPTRAHILSMIRSRGGSDRAGKAAAISPCVPLVSI